MLDQERKQEQQRVDDVVQVIKRKLNQLQQSKEGLKEDVIDLRKNFWEDVTVNMDEPDDVIETQASLKQQAEFLSERERSHGQLHKQLDTLQRLESSPYFGRIDFCEQGEEEVERIYLGIASLMTEDNEDFLIYDWRAPISSLYYDYSPGLASFQTPSGVIDGEMTLKRQFIIRLSVIKGMFDTGVTIGDEMLQEVLGNGSDAQMKSIVATIQKEQNKIIRNHTSKLLIVQGVAGSGKTSAALQRVAYLLYRDKETLHAKNVVLFSPNPLFNSYVATVLPELGEENMEQTTFKQFVETNIGDQFEVEDQFMQIEYTLTAMDDEGYTRRMAGIQFKSSLQFKQLIDQFIEGLTASGIVFRHLAFRGETFISADQMRQYFYNLDKTLTLSARLDAVRDWLIRELKEKEKIERTKEWVEEEIGLLDKADYLKAFQTLEEKGQFSEDTFDDMAREEEQLRRFVVKRRIQSLMKKVKKRLFINVTEMYKQLFTSLHGGWPEQWRDICKDTLTKIEDHELYNEDVTPYLYLSHRLLGNLQATDIKHVFIDEAQDYSPFQIALLKEQFPRSAMTVLGDFNQAIYPHTLNIDALLSADLYGIESHERIVLAKSYRSTKEIVHFTSSLLQVNGQIEPFNRSGEKPSLTVVKNEAIHHNQLLTKIKQLKDKYQTIAIICKTAQEAESVHLKVKDQIEVQLIEKQTSTFNKGVLLIPAYLAKGIEFDAVIIFDTAKYNREIERKLFYTACTRAMHELHLFSFAGVSPFMEAAMNNQLIIEEIPSSM